MKNLLIYGETHYRQNYLDQKLMDVLNKQTPNELKLLLIDPSLDSLSEFEGLSHLLEPICNGATTHDALNRICGEMERRKSGEDGVPILVVVDRWLPKNNIECASMIDEIIAEGEAVNIYCWLSLDDPSEIPDELRERVDGFIADKDSFEFDNDIYDKCLELTSNYKEKYG